MIINVYCNKTVYCIIVVKYIFDNPKQHLQHVPLDGDILPICSSIFLNIKQETQRDSSLDCSVFAFMQVQLVVANLNLLVVMESAQG